MDGGRPRVLHVTGARPNFPKAAPVIAALDDLGVPQRLVHTGQHYDDALSTVFFRELGLPEPDVNLGIGSASHAAQTAQAMLALESELVASAPGVVVVYGDINSTLAATLVAVKLGIPVVHVEAGLRSFDRSMPEEINRVLVDQVADLLLATSVDAVAHLAREGVDPTRVRFVGNPMIDTLLNHVDRLDSDAVRTTWGAGTDYVVCTLHRPSNVDDPASSRAVVEALHRAAELVDVVLPLHPRGRRSLEAAGLADHRRMIVGEPLGYLDFVGLVKGARAVVTDSGGIQEETTVLGVPCLTLRANTERPVTVTDGTNRLTTPADLASDLATVLADSPIASHRVPPLWDGRSGPRIATAVVELLEASA